MNLIPRIRMSLEQLELLGMDLLIRWFYNIQMLVLI